MTVKEYYLEALKHKYQSLQALIEFLVYEKQVLKFTDSEDKLTYYLQDKFRIYINQYLADYMKKQQGRKKA
jgi:hypothetical protein